VTRCDQARKIQDYLDHELPAVESEAFRRHLAGCATCDREVALYRRAFLALERLPQFDPGPAFTERVLARVVPARVRRRWVQTAAWVYGGTFAACIAAAVVAFTQPVPRAALQWLWSDASRRLVQATLFAINAVAYAMLALVDGWGLLATAGARLAPLARALEALLASPAIQSALVLAALACGAVLAWMRPREKQRGGTARHVGVLGF
jgi:anti-sigma factor RsiW